MSTFSSNAKQQFTIKEFAADTTEPETPIVPEVPVEPETPVEPEKPAVSKTPVNLGSDFWATITGVDSGMLIALNIIFLFIYILFLFFTKKHLYTVENIKSGKLKEYVRFEVILELAITLGYIIVSAIASIFVTNASILAGLLVPVYCLYYFMRNVFVATATTAATCIILLFIILVLPYTKRS